MLEQVLNYLHNWFVMAIYNDDYVIEDGKIELSFLKDGQYYRIIGSTFNDGLWQYGSEEDMTDESFNGAIWALAIPKMVIDVTKDIEAWQEKYGDAIAGPYNSESFGGYSYSKGTSYTSGEEVTWKSKFGYLLAPYRKLAEMANSGGYGSHQDQPYHRPFNPEYPMG